MVRRTDNQQWSDPSIRYIGFEQSKEVAQVIDMKSYAIRLAKAMPGRFVFLVSHGGLPGDDECWYLRSRIGDTAHEFNSECHLSEYWGVFGPLLDECGFQRPLSLPDCQTVLESVAEAVCQAVEAKAKEVGK